MKSAKSNFNLNCTVCASIIYLHDNKKIIVIKSKISHNTELLVNMKMHWSLWEIKCEIYTFGP